MTAEIAVMNKSGIALAADSAATISFPSKTSNRVHQKILSANKLFMLSKYRPVGIMIFGNASLMGIPWEIIIKEYRKTLSQSSFGRLVEYGNDFITYLNGNKAYFTEPLQGESVVNIVGREIHLILEKVQAGIFKLAQESESDDLPDLTKALDDLLRLEVNNRHDFLSSLEQLSAFRITRAHFRKKYGFIVDQLAGGIKRGDNIRPPAAVLGKLKDICYLAVTRNTFSRNSNTSGVVVAGYGENEIYPSLIAYDIEAVIDNKLKYLSTMTREVSHLEDAFVEPFAQGEMVQTFMNGVSPDHQDYVDSFIENVLRDYPDAVSRKLESLVKANKRESLATQCREVGNEFLTKFRDKLAAFIDDNNNSQVKLAVSILPVEQLASMASSLVNLTSLKRRVTPVSETVGGDVDVAVITKGDGFIWIERKHYFEADRNVHFFANYYTGDMRDEKPKIKSSRTKQNRSKV